MTLPLIQHAKLMSKRVKEISPRMWEVDGHTVTIKAKPGRTIMTCSCKNGTDYCLESVCSHKIACLFFEKDKKFLEEIDKVIKQYQSYQDNKLKCTTEMFIDELSRLKFLK